MHQSLNDLVYFAETVSFPITGGSSMKANQVVSIQDLKLLTISDSKPNKALGFGWRILRWNASCLFTSYTQQSLLDWVCFNLHLGLPS
jgi:hypothetical protein